MTDKRRHNSNERSEHAHNTVQAHIAHLLRNALGNGMQQAGAIHSLSKRQATSSQDNDGPQEIIEIFFSQDTRTEEQENRDDSNDTHISKDSFELVARTPERDGRQRNNGYEPLDAGEFVFHGSYGHDCGIPAWLESHEEQDPDQEDGDDADWKRNEEPDAPAWLR